MGIKEYNNYAFAIFFNEFEQLQMNGKHELPIDRNYFSFVKTNSKF